MIDLFMQVTDLKLGLEIDATVVKGAQTIFGFNTASGSINEDDRHLNGCDRRWE